MAGFFNVKKASTTISTEAMRCLLPQYQVRHLAVFEVFDFLLEHGELELPVAIDQREAAQQDFLRGRSFSRWHAPYQVTACIN